jgi:hypothetical protein
MKKKIATVTTVLFAWLVVAASASADYMHASQCRNGLRGYTVNNRPQDNEIAAWERAHSVGFIQWGSDWHPNNVPTYVYQYAWFSNGVAKLFWCSGDDLNFNDGPY